MKHAQEVEGWALDEANRITQTMPLNKATYVTVAKGLQRQHARSVRIVKAEIKRLKQDIECAQAKHDEVLENAYDFGRIIAENMLAALTKGRGKGGVKRKR